MEKARELWNDVMKAGFGNQAQKWLDYFHLERFVLNANCSVEFYQNKFADVTRLNPFVLLHVTGRLVITNTAARSSRGRSTRSLIGRSPSVTPTLTLNARKGRWSSMTWR